MVMPTGRQATGANTTPLGALNPAFMGQGPRPSEGMELLKRYLSLLVGVTNFYRLQNLYYFCCMFMISSQTHDIVHSLADLKVSTLKFSKNVQLQGRCCYLTLLTWLHNNSNNNNRSSSSPLLSGHLKLGKNRTLLQKIQVNIIIYLILRCGD